jgi:hypothetical protein
MRLACRVLGTCPEAGAPCRMRRKSANSPSVTLGTRLMDGEVSAVPRASRASKGGPSPAGRREKIALLSAGAAHENCEHGSADWEAP